MHRKRTDQAKERSNKEEQIWELVSQKKATKTEKRRGQSLRDETWN